MREERWCFDVKTSWKSRRSGQPPLALGHLRVDLRIIRDIASNHTPSGREPLKRRELETAFGYIKETCCSHGYATSSPHVWAGRCCQLGPMLKPSIKCRRRR
jgi:hypothetical protein